MAASEWNGCRSMRFKRALATPVFGALLVLALTPAASAPAPVRADGSIASNLDFAVSKDGIPNLASAEFAWLADSADWKDPPAGTAGHGPMRNDPDHPYFNNVVAERLGRAPTLRIGNYRDPVLKPWASKLIKDTNDEVLSGKMDVPFQAQARCWPGGVPGQLLVPAEPFYFIQTPKEVWMIWQRDHMVRRVYLTDKRSPAAKAQSFGDSIGHYEGGDTLVIDTIALSTKNNYIDDFRTPHSPKEHVIERYTITPNGKGLVAAVTVDDPDTFNEPLHMIQTWHKVANPLQETVCAENNNDAQFFHQKLYPIPEAANPDF